MLVDESRSIPQRPAPIIDGFKPQRSVMPPDGQHGDKVDMDLRPELRLVPKKQCGGVAENTSLSSTCLLKDGHQST